MIRTILVEDEYRATRLLRQLLEKHFPDDLTIVGQADKVKRAVDLVRETPFDLMFLDIQLGDGSGFDLLKQVERRDFDVIFVTAYEQFAIQAIRFAAFDYLLKPVKVSELKSAVEGIIARKQEQLDPESPRRELLVESLQPGQVPERIALPSREGYDVVRLNDMLFLEAESNYTHVHLVSGRRLTISRTLKEYEDLLQKSTFCRIHHGFLVNLDQVAAYIRGDGGAVRMTNGKELPVSRNRKSPLMQKLGLH